MEKFFCILIGYALGNILTAEIVTRRLTGRPCAELGTTGNPGMANVMAHLGFVPGIIVLAGDLAKTLAATLLTWLLFYNTVGHIAVLYAGLGAVAGHNWPVWEPARGGKGVSSTCAAIFVMSPLLGFISMIAGMLVVFVTRYLCVGGVVIPAVFTVLMFVFDGKEAGILGLVLTLIMVQRHWPALRLLPSGQCPKNDVWGAIRKKFVRSS